MRIAILSFEFPPATALGGISTYSAQAADMLASGGHDVEVFAGGTKTETLVRPSGARVHTLACLHQVEFAIPVTQAICRRHAEKSFDVLETPEYLAPAFQLPPLLPELPLVVRLHTPSALIIRINLPKSQWRQPWGMIGRQIKNALIAIWKKDVVPSVHCANRGLLEVAEIDVREAQVARAADVICSPSRALVSYPSTYWNVETAKTIHLPNIYQAPPPILAIPPIETPVCIGYFGRLEIRKGLLTLAKTLPAIAREFPKTKLLFVGQSTPLEGVHADAKEYVAEICRSLGLEAEFAGRQPTDKLHEWYSRCQIVMLPSIWENFPYVCLEAMAAGRAVIGSNAGGMADMITEGETGLLADPARPDEFARAAIKLLRDPALCTALGQAARQSVVARYSPAVLRPVYEKTYTQAVSHRRALGARKNPWIPDNGPAQSGTKP